MQLLLCFGLWYNQFCDNYLMERYRSGHNGAVLKTVRAQAHVGSSPTLSASLTLAYIRSRPDSVWAFFVSSFIV